MAGTIIVSSIKTDTDNSFIVRSNTGATLFSVDTTSISIPDGSITSAMIANGTVIAADVADGSITDAKIAAVANTKITGLVTAAQIANVANTQITGNITQSQIATGVAGTGPAFSAYTTTTQALTGAVTTKVNFGGEVFDTNSNFASSRFTPTVAGYYQLTTSLVYNAATFTDLYIYKNGSVYQAIFGNYSSSTYYAAGTGLIYLNGTTDYAEIYVYSSGSLSITSSQQNCWFSGAMVRSA